MLNINHYIDFTSSIRYRYFYRDDFESYYDYYFSLGDSGLFFIVSIASNSPLASDQFYYSPTENALIFDYSSYSWDNYAIIRIEVNSTSYKTYQITSTNDALYLYSAGSNLVSFSSTLGYYNFKENFFKASKVNNTTMRIVWNNVLLTGLKRIIFIDTFLWQWEDNVTYTGYDYDLARYPLVKYNGYYYLTSEVSWVVGRTYTFLMENGDCFSGSGPSGITGASRPIGLTGFAGAPNLGDGYLTIHNVKTPFESQSPATNENAGYIGYSDENTHEPSGRDRYSSFGINQHQVSFSPFTDKGLTGFLNKNNQFKKTTYSQSAPLQIASSINHTLGTDSTIYWLDQFYLWVDGTVYRIPLRWTVRYFYRRATDTVLTPTDGSQFIHPRLNAQVRVPTSEPTWVFLDTARNYGTTVTTNIDITSTYQIKDSIYNRDNTQTDAPAWPTDDLPTKTAQTVFDFSRHTNDGPFDPGVSLSCGYIYMENRRHYALTWTINYTLKNVPKIPIYTEYNQLPAEPENTGCSSTGGACLWTSARTNTGNWQFIHYIQQKGGAFGANRVLGGIRHTFQGNLGLCEPFERCATSSFPEPPSDRVMQVYVGDEQVAVHVDYLDTVDNDQAGATIHTICTDESFIAFLVAYPPN